MGRGKEGGGVVVVESNRHGEPRHIRVSWHGTVRFFLYHRYNDRFSDLNVTRSKFQVGGRRPQEKQSRT